MSTIIEILPHEILTEICHYVLCGRDIRYISRLSTLNSNISIRVLEALRRLDGHDLRLIEFIKESYNNIELFAMDNLYLILNDYYCSYLEPIYDAKGINSRIGLYLDYWPDVSNGSGHYCMTINYTEYIYEGDYEGICITSLLKYNPQDDLSLSSIEASIFTLDDINTDNISGFRELDNWVDHYGYNIFLLYIIKTSNSEKTPWILNDVFHSGWQPE
jgi:hypothetical protein